MQLEQGLMPNTVLRNLNNDSKVIANEASAPSLRQLTQRKSWLKTSKQGIFSIQSKHDLIEWASGYLVDNLDYDALGTSKLFCSNQRCQ